MPYNLIFAATDFLKGESGGITSIIKLIGLIILCALIIAASYFTTKFVGKRQMGGRQDTNFKSIDIYRVSPNKYLQIVEVGERYFCIAVAKDTITVLGELSKEDIKNFPPAPVEKSFKETMSEIINRKGQTDHTKPGEIIKQTENIEKITNRDDEEE